MKSWTSGQRAAFIPSGTKPKLKCKTALVVRFSNEYESPANSFFIRFFTYGSWTIYDRERMSCSFTM